MEGVSTIARCLFLGMQSNSYHETFWGSKHRIVMNITQKQSANNNFSTIFFDLVIKSFLEYVVHSTGVS